MDNLLPKEEILIEETIITDENLLTIKQALKGWKVSEKRELIDHLRALILRQTKDISVKESYEELKKYGFDESLISRLRQDINVHTANTDEHIKVSDLKQILTAINFMGFSQ